MSLPIQFFIGLLFGTGLVIAGMSDPQKVLNFLDIAAVATGGWDPSLAFVLAGATTTTFIGYKFVLQRAKPIFETTFHLPTATKIDQPLILGSAIFGIGWGLSGFCPGPAFTALGTLNVSALMFVAAMFFGMMAARHFASQLG